MKPSYRYYTAERGARFKSGDKELVLRKNDLFRLEQYEGHPCVIKDGGVYRVKKSLLSELKNRSDEASLDKVMKAKLEFFAAHGIDIEKVLVKNLKTLINTLKGSDVRHAFSNDTAWLAFNTSHDNRPESVTVVFSINANAIVGGLYYQEPSAIAGWEAIPMIEKSVRLFGKFLSSRYGFYVNKTSKGTARYGNIQVAQKPFSGRALTFSARWEL